MKGRQVHSRVIPAKHSKAIQITKPNKPMRCNRDCPEKTRKQDQHNALIVLRKVQNISPACKETGTSRNINITKVHGRERNKKQRSECSQSCPMLLIYFIKGSLEVETSVLRCVTDHWKSLQWMSLELLQEFLNVKATAVTAMIVTASSLS